MGPNLQAVAEARGAVGHLLAVCRRKSSIDSASRNGMIPPPTAVHGQVEFRCVELFTETRRLLVKVEFFLILYSNSAKGRVNQFAILGGEGGRLLGDGWMQYQRTGASTFPKCKTVSDTVGMQASVQVCVGLAQVAPPHFSVFACFSDACCFPRAVCCCLR